MKKKKKNGEVVRSVEYHLGFDGKCGSVNLGFGQHSAVRDERSKNLIGLFQEVSRIQRQLILRKTSGASVLMFGQLTGCILIGSDY